jgi:uncharacterized protein (UPF0264 family)
LAGLLVSVRSVPEARAALAGGASVIDVKEPERGPLGCAEVQVWRDIRGVVPAGLPVSVALGELRDWVRGGRRPPEPGQFDGLAYRKLGLSGAGAGAGWERAWAALRREWGPGPSWIAVVYADWARAEAPDPDAVAEAAMAAEDCAGLLIDTWDKSRPSPIAADAFWCRWFDRVRTRSGGPLLIALAGGLDAAAIARLAPLGPDLFAVRGAACDGGDRRGAIDPGRVAVLVRAVAGATPPAVGLSRSQATAR